MQQDGLKDAKHWGEVLQYAYLLHYITTHNSTDPEEKSICQFIKRSLLSALESLEVLQSGDKEQIKQHHDELQKVMNQLAAVSMCAK